MTGPNAANEPDPSRDNSEQDHLDTRLFDRLVDGELAEADRRTLLLSLDHQPSGWRQCALAFLEAQSWRDLLGSAAEEPAPAAAETAVETAEAAIEPIQKRQLESGAAEFVSTAASFSPPRRRGLPRHWLWIGEMAASFLVAFSLGLWIRGGFVTTNSGAPGSVATITDPRVATDQRAAPRGASEQAGNGTQVVDMVIRGAGGQEQRMQVPLVDNRGMGWWQSQPPAVVPDAVRRTVEQAGGRIRQERRYWSVELPDGRRALVPVDQIEVVPAGMQ
jgi:hypothetical protein